MTRLFNFLSYDTFIQLPQLYGTLVRLPQV
jgi:hypothetical protein